jgi:hypothetical protein
VGGYRVRIQRYKGTQICPFAPQPHENPCQAGGGLRLGSIDWQIRNTRTGLRLFGPGLIAHLIAAHGFFEGSARPTALSRAPSRNCWRSVQSGHPAVEAVSNSSAWRRRPSDVSLGRLPSAAVRSETSHSAEDR